MASHARIGDGRRLCHRRRLRCLGDATLATPYLAWDSYMSRIDDALRRAGTSRSRASAAGSDAATAFVSPWEFDDNVSPVVSEPIAVESEASAPATAPPAAG